jgi:hypothetical protein
MKAVSKPSQNTKKEYTRYLMFSSACVGKAYLGFGHTMDGEIRYHQGKSRWQSVNNSGQTAPNAISPNYVGSTRKRQL